jgi:hypothetical protein
MYPFSVPDRAWLPNPSLRDSRGPERVHREEPEEPVTRRAVGFTADLDEEVPA